MIDTLLAYFERGFPVTDEDQALIKTLFISRKMKKGEILVREGEVAKYAAFVCTGCLRSYVIDDKGKEHILQFAPENWWISEKGTPTDGIGSSLFIDAIEDSDVLLLDVPGHLKLLEKVPGYAALFHTGTQKRSAAKDKRILHSLSSTAEERYNDFLKTYPSIAQKVHQHMLASYLGITPETLSRLRRRTMTKK